MAVGWASEGLERRNSRAVRRLPTCDTADWQSAVRGGVRRSSVPAGCADAQAAR